MSPCLLAHLKIHSEKSDKGNNFWGKMALYVAPKWVWFIWGRRLHGKSSFWNTENLHVKWKSQLGSHTV